MTKAPATQAVGRFRVVGTWLALTLEETTRAFWRPASTVLLMAGLALCGLLTALPVWLHAAVLLLALGVIAVTAWRDVRHFRWPDLNRVLGRLEDVNGLEHRPLRALGDSPAWARDMKHSVAGVQLWAHHRTWLQGRVGRLRVGAPRPVLSGIDGRGLRFLAGLVFVIGLVIAQGSWQQRLIAGVWPQPALPADAKQVVVDAWLSPPEYTRIPPVILKPQADAAASADADESRSALAERQASKTAVPEDSKLTVRINYAFDAPVLWLPDDSRVPLQKDAKAAYSLERRIQSSGLHEIRIGDMRLASWDFAVLPDHKPTVAFKGQPQESRRNTVFVRYLAQDDYGVEKLSLHIRLAGDEDTERTESFTIPVVSRDRSTLDGSHYFDLTPHPWAGLQAMVWLRAEDAKGQRGQGRVLSMVLPQRTFNHPVARAVIRERRRLASRGVAVVAPVTQALRDIAWDADAYNHQTAVFLGLTVAAARLERRDAAGQVPSVLQLLWNTALRLEDGGVSLAAAELKAAEQALLEAMARGAGTEELDRLMDKLEQAMAKYVEAMRQQAVQDNKPDQKHRQQEQQARQLNAQSLQSMMDRLRQMLRMGMTGAAQKLLEEMQQMMQNLRMAEDRALSGEGGEALEMLKDLQDIMGQQQELLERSHNRAMGRSNDQDARGRADGQEGARGSEGDAARQDSLRQRLDSLRDSFDRLTGQTPDALGGATRDMQDAAEALSRGRSHRAVQSQGKALEQMQDASRRMQQTIMEKYMGRGMADQQVNGVTKGGGKDPFGRQPMPGVEGGDDGETVVPDEGTMQRAREIRDELRRRSGEPDRPPVERDYINRLLRPF